MKSDDEKRPSFWAHAEEAERRVSQWPDWKREAARARLVSQPAARRDPPPVSVIEHRDEQAGTTTRIELDRAQGVARIAATFDRPLETLVYRIQVGTKVEIT